MKAAYKRSETPTEELLRGLVRLLHAKEGMEHVLRVAAFAATRRIIMQRMMRRG